jgi:cobalt/nickel transport system permease protein
MHIMEGFLLLEWRIFWFLVLLPFLAYGMYKLNCYIKECRDTLPFFAVGGTFIFVLPALKMPLVTVSGSQSTGTGLGTIIFGPDDENKIRISVHHFGGDRS